MSEVIPEAIRSPSPGTPPPTEPEDAEDSSGKTNKCDIRSITT